MLLQQWRRAHHDSVRRRFESFRVKACSSGVEQRITYAGSNPASSKQEKHNGYAPEVCATSLKMALTLKAGVSCRDETMSVLFISIWQALRKQV